MRIVLLILTFYLPLQLVFANADIDSLKNELNNTEQKAVIYSQIADKYIYISSDLAENFANKAIKQALKENDTTIFAEIYRIKGIIKYNKSEVDSAFYYFYKSAEISKNTNNIYGQASTLVNIGGLFFDLKEFKKSENAFLEALQLFKKTDSKKGISSIYNNLGFLYQQTQEYDKAIEYLQKSKKIKQEINDKIGSAKLLINIANIQKNHNKNYSEAIKLLNEALLTFTELGSDILVSKTYNNISDVYLENNDLQNAKTNALTALSIAEKANYIKEISVSYGLLYKIYLKEDNYKKALEYYTLLEKYNKQMISEKSNKTLQNIKIKYETEQKEAQIKIKEQQLIIKNRQFTYLLIFSIVLVVLLVIVFIQKQQTKMANKDLVKKNLEIVNSENKFRDTQAELETIIDNIKNDKPELNKKITKSSTVVANEDELLVKIKKCMNEEKLFLNKNLTTVLLAKKLDTNKTYISKVINDNFNKNFSTYVNEYRIKYARTLLADNITKKYTIEYISETSGFNSVTAFNKAFKKYTGVTPSFFIKNLD